MNVTARKKNTLFRVNLGLFKLSKKKKHTTKINLKKLNVYVGCIVFRGNWDLFKLSKKQKQNTLIKLIWKKLNVYV